MMIEWIWYYIMIMNILIITKNDITIVSLWYYNISIYIFSI